MTPWRAGLAALTTALAVTAAAAQSGGLRVKVLEAKDGFGLPGATVLLSHATQNVGATTEVTDREGVVLFPVLRPGGGYAIEVSFPGYAKVRLPNLRVRINQVEEIAVGLWESIRETVVVQESPQVVNLDRTESSTTFSDDFLRDLPVMGRFYQNMLTLAPGVLDDDGDGNPNVHGARDRDFKAIVGGVSNVDPLTGQWLSRVNPDSIEEIEIITAGAGVEYGRAQGGFANIIQKQGSNDFEGLFSFLFRTSKLDGNGATSLSGNRLPKFDSIQPAAQISGPIVRDKLWYVLSHEYIRDEIPVNTLTDVVVSERRQPIGADRLTWQASPRNKFSLQYLSDPLTVTNFGVTSRRPATTSQRHELGGPTYMMEWTAPYSPKLLVDSLVAYQDIHANFLPMTTGVPNGCVSGYSVLENAECFSLRTGLLSGSYFRTHRDKRQRLTVKSQAELYGGRFWGMTQQFKFGFIVENERYFRYLRRGPLATFLEVSGSTRDQVAFLTTQFSVPEATTSRATGTTWGIYGEDQLKLLNNLTATVGLRLDREIVASKGVLPFDPEAEAARFLDETSRLNPRDWPNVSPRVFTAYEDVRGFVDELARILHVDPSLLGNALTGTTRQSEFWPRRRRPGDINLVNTNLSPFLSISWDPWGDGKTGFKLSAGRHYNNVPLIVPTIELNPPSTVITFRTVRQAGQWVIPLAADGTPRQLGGVQGINPALSVHVVDRQLRTPYQDEWTLAFERELVAETLLRLTYVSRRFRDQLQDIDINHAPGDYGSCVTQLLPGDPTILPLPNGGVNGRGGDGIPDDCVGRLETLFGSGGGPGSSDYTVQRPDGFLDTYVLNPAWGAIYLVGNFNQANYDGVTLELQRRLYRGWEMNGSYTWSKAKGNAEDFDQALGDDRATLDDEFGFLAYDQRHALKLNASTITPWGFRLGTTVGWQSGLPYSLLRLESSMDAVPTPYGGLGVSTEPRTRLRYVTRRRNDQRNESYWNFNVKVTKELNLKGGSNLQLSAEVFNLLNDDPLRIFDQTNGSNSAVRAFGRRYQMGMRLAF